mgnify:CR=1 FL=1
MAQGLAGNDISQILVGETLHKIKDAEAREKKLDKTGGTITGDLTIQGKTSGIKIDELSQNSSAVVILNCGTSTTNVANRLAAPQVSLNGTEISWQAVPNATGYNIYVDNNLAAELDADGNKIS